LIDPNNIQWQKAVDEIKTQDPATIEQRKANISKLIATFNRPPAKVSHDRLFRS
jgi:hypothetical protein